MSLTAALVSGLIVIAAIAATPGAARSQAGLVVAVDARVTGNTPRQVQAIDECTSANVGDTLEVDIVAPEPGIPGDRGIAAYELTFYYDLNIINVVAADYNQLLKQAPGSNLFAVGSELPDASGEFHAVVGDFGKAGVEPAGTSEVGSGVLTRLTLRVVGAGVTPLGLRGVDLRDDGGNPIAIAESRRGTLYAGAACPVPTAAPTQSPGGGATTAPGGGTAATGGGGTAAATAAANPSEAPGGSGTQGARLTAKPSGTAGDPDGGVAMDGGRRPAGDGGGSSWAWVLVAGCLLAVMAGAGLLVQRLGWRRCYRLVTDTARSWPKRKQ